METSDRAGEKSAKEIISEYMRELQKKSARKRLENDPNTYKKMRALREEAKEDLKIILSEDN